MGGKKIILTEDQFKNLLGFKWDGYSPVHGTFNMNAFYFKDKGLIEEGVFKTYDIDFVVKHFCSYLQFSDNYSKFSSSPSSYNGFITKVASENGLYYIELVVYYDEELLNKVKETLGCCGYYMAFSGEYCDGYTVCGFEKLHEDSTELNVGKIYHVTARENKLKIGRDGLVPKAKNKKTYHKERVYFFTEDYGHEGFLNIAKMLYSKHPSTFGYVVYEVDANKLGDVVFHYDPNTENGVYTTDNIPPTALTIKYEYKK